MLKKKTEKKKDVRSCVDLSFDSRALKRFVKHAEIHVVLRKKKCLGNLGI